MYKRQILQRAPILRRAFQQEFGTFISGEINNVIERQGITIEQALSNVIARSAEGPRADPRTFTNAVERFRDTVDDLLRDIGGGLLPTLKEFIEGLRNFINFLRSPAGRIVLGGVVGAAAGAGIARSTAILGGAGFTSIGLSGISGSDLTELQRGITARAVHRRRGLAASEGRQSSLTAASQARFDQFYTQDVIDAEIRADERLQRNLQIVREGTITEDGRTRRAGPFSRVRASLATRAATSGGIAGALGGPLGILLGAGLGFGAGAITEARVQSQIEEINASVIELADSFTRLAEVAPGIRTLRENVSELNDCLLYTSPSPRD